MNDLLGKIWVITEKFTNITLQVVILVHLACAPYTKVEESFNIQAIHDISAFGIPIKNVNQTLISQYDHSSFPGSVPRTFVGSLILAGISKIPIWPAWAVASWRLQFIARATLGSFNAIALGSFSNAVEKAYGKTTRHWYILLQASQFHVVYYASRTLPNMFAFGLSTFALRSLLLSQTIPPANPQAMKQVRLSIYLLTIAGVIFRSELAIFLAAVVLVLLLRGKISIGEVVVAGLKSATVAVFVTIPIDSYFWQKPFLWPEFVGFYYNTILGRSSDWGTSPFYFYFLNAIPRLLLNPLSLILIPFSLLNLSTRSQSLTLIAPSLIFVGVYSILPHKEWRFIIYIIPALTAVAASSFAWIWDRRSKTLLHRILSLGLVGSIVFSFAISTVLLLISSLNYSGAEALVRLHDIAAKDYYTGRLSAHLDNLACQTGVTRFLELYDPADDQNAEGLSHSVWKHDKTEDQEKLLDPNFWQTFDYALAERPEKVIGKWEIVDVVWGFAGVEVMKPGGSGGGGVEEAVEEGLAKISSPEEQKGWVIWLKNLERWCRPMAGGWWVSVRMEPKIMIMKRQRIYSEANPGT
ncbi:glycosyltransferase family 22 protein [Patellaria atrata CBS 101060]|uniref:Mannosyltransferase n=1 Tax=Patellaria atrata CBS 101060 TaxID=1346257 RepID=A0A9P4VNF4_9PEZI|nr:glycosyltransferase family 22 protein [Patellaria atrata CBS 101060]